MLALLHRDVFYTKLRNKLSLSLTRIKNIYLLYHCERSCRHKTQKYFLLKIEKWACIIILFDCLSISLDYSNKSEMNLWENRLNHLTKTNPVYGMIQKAVIHFSFHTIIQFLSVRCTNQFSQAGSSKKVASDEPTLFSGFLWLFFAVTSIFWKKPGNELGDEPD